MRDPATCAGCGGEAERSTMWERFTMLRRIASKGGGRQRTKAGHATSELYCDACARREDDRVRGIAWPAENLALDLEAR